MVSGEIVLDYYDVTVYKEDLEIIESDEWLNDNNLAFWYEYLEHTILGPKAAGHGPHLKQRDFTLMRPSMVFLLGQIQDVKDLKDVLPSMKTSKFIFMPINDNMDISNPEGGSHWSLVVVDTVGSFAYHYDSLIGVNRITARNIVGQLDTFLTYLGGLDAEQSGADSDSKGGTPLHDDSPSHISDLCLNQNLTAGDEYNREDADSVTSITVLDQTESEPTDPVSLSDSMITVDSLGLDVPTRGYPLHGRRLKFVEVETTPQQENSSDCGVYVCTFTSLLLERLESSRRWHRRHLPHLPHHRHRFNHASDEDEALRDLSNVSVSDLAGRRNMLDIINGLILRSTKYPLPEEKDHIHHNNNSSNHSWMGSRIFSRRHRHGDKVKSSGGEEDDESNSSGKEVSDSNGGSRHSSRRHQLFSRDNNKSSNNNNNSNVLKHHHEPCPPSKSKESSEPHVHHHHQQQQPVEAASETNHHHHSAAKAKSPPPQPHNPVHVHQPQKPTEKPPEVSSESNHHHHSTKKAQSPPPQPHVHVHQPQRPTAASPPETSHHHHRHHSTEKAKLPGHSHVDAHHEDNDGVIRDEPPPISHTDIVTKDKEVDSGNESDEE